MADLLEMTPELFKEIKTEAKELQMNEFDLCFLKDNSEFLCSVIPIDTEELTRLCGYLSEEYRVSVTEEQLVRLAFSLRREKSPAVSVA